DERKDKGTLEAQQERREDFYASKSLPLLFPFLFPLASFLCYLIAPPGNRSMFCLANIHPGYSGGSWLASFRDFSSSSVNRTSVAAMLSVSCCLVLAPTMT